jgi:hypothetical protein
MALENMLRVVKRCGIIYISVIERSCAIDIDQPALDCQYVFGYPFFYACQTGPHDYEELVLLFPRVDSAKEEKRLKAELRDKDVIELLFDARHRCKLPFVIQMIYCGLSEVIIILEKSPI